jgi:hypothetical protein
MYRNKKVKLRQFVFWGYVLPFIIFILVSSYYLYYNNREVSISHTNFYTMSALNELNKNINNDVTQMINLSYYVCKQTLVKNLISSYGKQADSERLISEQMLIDQLADPFKYNLGVANINVYIEGKNLYGTSYNSVIPLDYVKNSNWYKKVKGENQYIDENQILDSNRLPYVKEKISQNHVITIFTAIKNNSDEIVAYLSVDISVFND